MLHTPKLALRSLLFCSFVLSCALPVVSAAEGPSPVKKVVLIAGKKSHGPGVHEYEKDVKLLKHFLDTSPNTKHIKAEAHFDGWPQDPKTLDDADTIVLLSDGLDKQYPLDQHPFLKGDHLQVIERQVRRGCGLVVIHWPMWVPSHVGQETFMPWLGGFCDYENPPGPGMSDKVDWTRQLGHPICRGVRPFEFQDEYYANVRFLAEDSRFTPILPFAAKPKERLWAWAWQRDDGGRSFVFIGGHPHKNWEIPELRKTVLNAIVWTTKAEVPAGGVESTMPDATAQAAKPVRTLIVTGHHHPGHPWQASTPALQEVLWADSRVLIDVLIDPEQLASLPLADYDVVVQNYCNWQRAGLGEEAKAALVKYVSDGGGLAIIHFANGAFGPGARPPSPEANWPEYCGKLCRRVWIDGKSGHDAFGPFRAEITSVKHPITEGLQAFETVDELYFSQQGDEPVEPLATARSKVTGKDEPMAFAYPYGKGRIYQTLLGHAVESIRNPGAAALIARGCLWAAGAELSPAVVAAPVEPREASRFGKALDAREMIASLPEQPAFSQPPLTVECWVRLDGKTGFNVFIGNEPKSSGTHWEVYTYAGTGALCAYLPGYKPALVNSTKDIADGQWHYVAMTFDGKKVALYADAEEVLSAEVARHEQMPAQPGPLTIGRTYVGESVIGCDGLVDEVRISKTVRPIDRVPDAPLAADAETIGLWHFEDDPQSMRFTDASSSKNHADLELNLN